MLALLTNCASMRRWTSHKSASLRALDDRAKTNSHRSKRRRPRWRTKSTSCNFPPIAHGARRDAVPYGYQRERLSASAMPHNVSYRRARLSFATAKRRRVLLARWLTVCAAGTVDSVAERVKVEHGDPGSRPGKRSPPGVCQGPERAGISAAIGLVYRRNIFTTNL